MPTFTINQHQVTVTDDRGDSFSVASDSSNFAEACECALSARWADFLNVATTPNETPSAQVVFGVANNMEEVMDNLRSFIEDTFPDDDDEEQDEPEQDEINPNDLSNWNGSPIYYLTKEQAQAQVAASCGFWKYHDFGVTARCSRRYATVPTGFGPTAPEGYEWACVSIEG